MSCSEATRSLQAPHLHLSEDPSWWREVPSVLHLKTKCSVAGSTTPPPGEGHYYIVAVGALPFVSSDPAVPASQKRGRLGGWKTRSLGHWITLSQSASLPHLQCLQQQTDEPARMCPHTVEPGASRSSVRDAGTKQRTPRPLGRHRQRLKRDGECIDPAIDLTPTE